jgi:hypothetical protein
METALVNVNSSLLNREANCMTPIARWFIEMEDQGIVTKVISYALWYFTQIALHIVAIGGPSLYNQLLEEYTIQRNISIIPIPNDSTTFRDLDTSAIDLSYLVPEIHQTPEPIEVPFEVRTVPESASFDNRSNSMEGNQPLKDIFRVDTDPNLASVQEESVDPQEKIQKLRETAAQLVRQEGSARIKVSEQSDDPLVLKFIIMQRDDQLQQMKVEREKTKRILELKETAISTQRAHLDSKNEELASIKKQNELALKMLSDLRNGGKKKFSQFKKTGALDGINIEDLRA